MAENMESFVAREKARAANESTPERVREAVESLPHKVVLTITAAEFSRILAEVRAQRRAHANDWEIVTHVLDELGVTLRFTAPPEEGDDD